MPLGPNVLKDAPDRAVRPNDHRIPPDFSGLGASAIGPANLAVAIGQQGVWKLIFSGKGRVDRHWIHADTQNLRVQRLKVADSITESGALGNSARCIGLRVKPQHHRFPPKIA